MIDRIVLFKLTETDATPEQRAAIAAESRAALAGVPGVREARVGVPADEPSARSWDLSVVLRFDDLDAMTRAVAEPGFVAWFEGAVGPRAEVVKHWAFEVEG